MLEWLNGAVGLVPNPGSLRAEIRIAEPRDQRDQLVQLRLHGRDAFELHVERVPNLVQSRVYLL
jgi:hypothetical protein